MSSSIGGGGGGGFFSKNQKKMYDCFLVRFSLPTESRASPRHSWVTRCQVLNLNQERSPWDLERRHGNLRVTGQVV